MVQPFTIEAYYLSIVFISMVFRDNLASLEKILNFNR